MSDDATILRGLTREEEALIGTRAAQLGLTPEQYIARLVRRGLRRIQVARDPNRPPLLGREPH